MPVILSLRGIHKDRSPGFALEIPCLDVARGERVALVGPSGCGKSTALDILATVLSPDGGESFRFVPQDGDEVDILATWRAKQREALAMLRLHHVGYVLQTGGLLPFLSARGNILLGRDPSRRQREAVDALADTLGIRELLDFRPGRLSVGERQRVAIARALISDPALVLADEPAAALDPLNANTVMRLFTRLAEERGITVVLVTHSPQMAKDMGFRMISTVVRRQDGRTVACMGEA